MKPALRSLLVNGLVVGGFVWACVGLVLNEKGVGSPFMKSLWVVGGYQAFLLVLFLFDIFRRRSSKSAI